MVAYDQRIEWFKDRGLNTTAELITDSVSLIVKRGLNSKGNKTDLRLKNGLKSINADGTFVYDWTNSSNELLIQQNDIIKIYAKVQVTADDSIDTGTTSPDLLTTAEVEEFSTVYTSGKTQLKVSCFDRTYEVLNNLWAESFVNSDGFTAPQIVQQVVRSVTDGIPGEGFTDSGTRVNPGKYSVDARLFSGEEIFTGTTTSTTSDKLVDSGKDFTAGVDPVAIGDLIHNTTDKTYARVTAIDGATTLSIDSDIMVSGEAYIVTQDSVVELGTTTSATTNKLVDSGQNFQTTVDVGDLVRNISTNKYATVSAIDSNTTLSLTKDIMTSSVRYLISDGFIQDTRNNGTVFPTISMSKVWRAAYEWLENLSETRNTNTTAEINGTVIEDRKHVYYLDEKNRVHWFYPQDDAEYDLTTGSVSTDGVVIKDMQLVKKTFDIINMVIFNGGKDLSNVGTLNYYYNESSELRTLKMKYIPMLDIGNELREDEVTKGGITIAADDVVSLVGSYPYTPSWLSTTVGNDADYRTAFRARVIELCRIKSASLTSHTARPRWAKNITTNFFNFIPGELLKITSRQYGLQEELLRIKDVTHNLNKGAFTTSIEVEEDEPKIGASA